MDKIYLLLTGPGAYISFALFFGGIIYRVVLFIYLAKKRDHEVLTYFNIPYAMRSVFAWSVPFYARSWRKAPLFTILTYLFHISIFLVPLFLSAHIIMLQLSWHISYPWIPDHLANIFTLLGIICCALLALRRVLDRGIRYITTASDWYVLGLTFLVLLSGFVSYNQLLNYRLSIILHVFLGELLLVSIPFTKLSHMIISPFLRGYMGSEFGAVRGVKDW